LYHHDCWWNFHEIPWNPMEIPLSHCQIVPLETRFCFPGWGAEDDLTLTNLRPRSRGSMWMWQSRSVANQLKRPSYRDMSSYTKLYISRYTLAYYAHLCTSRHYVHHLRSGAVYAVHNLHIRRRFTNMTYHSEWSPEDAKKLSFFQELLCWASAPEGHCFNLLSGLASFSDTPTCCQMMRKSAIVVSLIGSNHYHQPSLKAKLCLSFQISPTIIYLSFIESAWFFSIPVTRLKDEQAHQTAEEWTSTSLGNP